MRQASEAWLRLHADSRWDSDTVMGIPMDYILDNGLSAEQITRIAYDMAGRSWREYDGFDVPVEADDDQCSTQTRSNSMHNTSLYMPIVNRSITMVHVKFSDDGKTYTYKAAEEYSVNDIVVVEARGFYAVARVTKINVPIPVDDTLTQFRWVVQRIDVIAHEEMLIRERDVINKINDIRTERMRDQMLSALGLTGDEVRNILGHTEDENMPLTEREVNAANGD